MEEKMKYDEVMMNTALIWSEQSYCKRRKVGAVISKDGRILATGYNGTIAGLDNKCEDEYYQCNHCNAKDKHIESLVESYPSSNVSYPINMEFDIKCKHCRNNIAKFRVDFHGSLERVESEDHFSKVLITNDFTVHAEQNIVSYCAKEGIPLKGSTIYITTSPCRQCAKLIAQSGITRVVYKDAYKDLSGVKFLEIVSIQTEQLKRLSYVEKCK